MKLLSELEHQNKFEESAPCIKKKLQKTNSKTTCS